MKSGEEIKKILVDGARKMGGLHSYINYEYGRETSRDIYGEEWRLKRLRQLKRRYDPKNQFRFYAPILLVKE
jgi:FAD/FMN-containing dehydrogenase